MSRRIRMSLSSTAVLACLLVAGCGDSDEEAPQDLGGGISSTVADSPLSVEQVEVELKQFRPEASEISCEEAEDGTFDCTATLDGRDVVVNGTPTEDGVGFTFAGPQS